MEKIQSLYASFVDDIVRVFPEYKERLSISDTTDEMYQFFLKNLRTHILPISERDSTWIQSDPILINNVSFKMMFQSNISKKTTNTLWKYLQTFCVLMITMESEDKMNDVLQKIEGHEKIKDKKTVSEMKLLKKLNASIQEHEGGDEESEEIPEDMQQMSQLFESTDIGRIAKQITEEIDIEGMMQEGGGGIESLMNPQMMTQLFGSISSKMAESDSLDADKLMGEASTICESMKGNPMFESIMGGLNSQGIPSDTKQVRYKDTSHNAGGTRERLRKKLQQKQAQKVIVEKQGNNDDVDVD